MSAENIQQKHARQLQELLTQACQDLEKSLKVQVENLSRQLDKKHDGRMQTVILTISTAWYKMQFNLSFHPFDQLNAVHVKLLEELGQTKHSYIDFVCELANIVSGAVCRLLAENDIGTGMSTPNILTGCGGNLHMYLVKPDYSSHCTCKVNGATFFGAHLYVFGNPGADLKVNLQFEVGRVQKEESGELEFF